MRIGRVTLELAISRRSLLATALAAGGVSMVDAATLAKARQSFFARVRRPIGLQVYTLGEEPAKDLAGTFARLAAIGYKDIELPNLFGKSARDVKAAADAAGLTISALHVAAAPMAGPITGTLQEPPEKVAEMMAALGCKNAVVPIMLFPAGLRPAPGETFQVAIARAMAEAGSDIWKRTAAVLNEKAAALKPMGINLGYHNHNLEFAKVGKTTGWQILEKETEAELVTFEIDVGWIAAAGLDPVAFFNAHKGRIRQMHVKDVQASTKTNYALSMDPCAVGDGKLDWAKILPAAYNAGVRSFYVEQEPPFTMARMDAAKKSYDYLAAVKA
jgi:sugar phosphate isomerase/epimerase